MDSEINLSNCCRTCLRLGCPLIPINSDDKDSVKFSFKLMSCIAEIAWSRIDIQSLICDQCIEQLRISYNFRNTCITADETLQKCVKQSLDRKIESKNNVLFDPKYNCVDGNTRHDSISNLPDEDTNNSEYLHLKHFLDSEEVIGKNEAILSDNEMSRSSTPETTEGPFINNYNQSQTIEIEVQDIQEIIIQAKPDEVREQNKLILSDAEEYSIQDLNTNNDNTEIGITDKEQPSIVNHSKIGENEESYNKEQNEESTSKEKVTSSVKDKNAVLVHFDSLAGASAGESILGSDQVGPLPKMYTVIKATKSTGVQVRPPTPEGKQPTKPVGNPNTCTICGNIYKKRANLKVHMRSHTGEKPFECKYCEKRFYHSSHLKEHIRRHTGEKPFHCDLCTKRFTIRGELTMHMRSHTGEKPFACTVCDRRCLTSSDLKIHMRTHTGERPYTCENCGKKFSSAYILNSHMKIHTGERPFPCKLCEKSFTQSSHLNVHMKKHTGEKFSCKFCPATFSHSSQLTVHKREHTGKQPYKCGVCNKLCNYSSELQTHMTRHTGQKFSCTICQKQFSTSAYLSEHTRVHTGENLFTCTVCDRTFTRHQYLEKHIRTHTGEKPYSCFVCEKTFSQSSSLRVHTRIHTGERPYACNLCVKTFVTSSDLSSHVKKHKKYLDL